MEQSSKKNLQSLDKYIALGFDADHCLVRYKLNEFFYMLYKRIAKFLVEQHSYPDEMLLFGKKEKGFILNGLVIDYKTGYIMKLGENKVILRAYHGYDRVSQEDLEKRYGSPPKFDIFDPYTCNHEDYQCCVSFFECFFPPLLAHMIAYKKKTHHLEDINVREIYRDTISAYDAIIYDYLKEVSTKLDTVFYKQDKMREILKSLREKGKVLFLVSNGPAIYLSLIMSYAYGEDWKTLFDFIVPSSAKPRFFTEEALFCGCHDSKHTTELERHGLYTGGNAKTLEENIKKLNGGKEGRILFFGDHYSTDVLAAERIEHWDGVCIMEELEGVGFGEDYDDSYWGHWQYEDTAQGRVETLWYSYMSNNVAICTPLVDSSEMVSFFEGKERV